MASKPVKLTRQQILAEITRLRTQVADLQDTNFYSKLFQNAPIPFTFTTLETGDFIAVNQMFEKLSGFSQAELTKRVDSESKPINPLLRLQLSSLLPEDNFVQKFETIIYDKQGDPRFVIASCQVVELNDTMYALSAFYDVTESKQAREVLLRSEELYRILARNLPDTAVFLYDADLRYLKVEGTLLATNNYSPKWMEGKTLSEILSPARVKKLEPYYRAALEGREVSFEDLVSNGSTYWVKAVPVKNEEGEIVAGMVMTQDITQRKEIERLKNEFVSTVSHELRTPLTSIRGSLGLVLGGVAGELPAQATAMVEIAYKNSERLVRLINDILDVEKIESGKMVFDMSPLELGPVIGQALEANLAYAAQLNVNIRLERPLPAVKVMADGDRLLQVLANLLSNAAKFSPAQDEVLITVTQKAGTVRISITDHGPGISDEFRKTIFQKFAQADTSATRQKGGTGLGLSISKAIVEKHNGLIGFENMPGAGTTFYFELPEFIDRIALLDNPASELQPRILICEDDPDVATLLKVMIKETGFSCDIAYSAEQARELLGINSYSAMTLDLILPGLGGMLFLRELRENPATKLLHIIVISVKSNETRQSLDGFQPALIEWIDKPIDQNLLRVALNRIARPVQNAIPAGEALDPVCRMTVEIATAHHMSEFEGRLYYFCGAGCKLAFEKTPQAYLRPSDAQ